MLKFIPFQEISTERLIIRKIKNEEDVNDLSNAIRPYCSEFKYDIRLLEQNRKIEQNPQNLIFDDWLICLREDNKIIGEISLSFKQDTGIAEWVYYLDGNYLGKGYGAEAFSEFAKQIINPAIGKICDYIDNLDDINSDLVIKEKTLQYAYGMVDHISNYPSLGISLKAGAHVQAIIKDFIVCTIDEKNKRDNYSLDNLVTQLSKKVCEINNFDTWQQNAEVQKFLLRIIREQQEPYTILSSGIFLLQDNLDTNILDKITIAWNTINSSDYKPLLVSTEIYKGYGVNNFFTEYYNKLLNINSETLDFVSSNSSQFILEESEIQPIGLLPYTNNDSILQDL